MVQLDLGGALDRIEKHVGTRATRGIVILGAVVVVVGLMKLLIEWVSPLIAAVLGIVSGFGVGPDWSVVIAAFVVVLLLLVPSAAAQLAALRAVRQSEWAGQGAVLGVKGAQLALESAKNYTETLLQLNESMAKILDTEIETLDALKLVMDALDQIGKKVGVDVNKISLPTIPTKPNAS